MACLKVLQGFRVYGLGFSYVRDLGFRGIFLELDRIWGLHRGSFSEAGRDCRAWLNKGSIYSIYLGFRV